MGEPCELPRCFGHVFYADLPHFHSISHFIDGDQQMMQTIYGAEKREQLPLPGFVFDSDGFVMWPEYVDTV